MTKDPKAQREFVDRFGSSDCYLELKERLPVTEDGIVVFPGMVVYWHKYGFEQARVHSVSSECWSQYGGGQPHYIRDGSVPYFSTPELAKRWHADQKMIEAEQARAS